MHELGATRDNSPFLFNLAILTPGFLKPESLWSMRRSVAPGQL